MKPLSILLSSITIANGAFGAGNIAANSISDDTSSSQLNPGCPNLSPGPISFFQLAQSFPPTVLEDAAAIEAIRRTLAVYPLAIDGRNFDMLNRIFAGDARANYSAPIGVLNGIDEIKNTLSASLAAFAGTQHSYSTQLIDICSSTTAVSVTYYTAAHFFTPGIGVIATPTDVLYAYGQYQDTWRRIEDGTWRITNRNLVYMGPFITAASV
ncbi:hypothetical protein GQ53DRAFT_134630 [Thozetella sp. PMI_491]|nr:hypothetical protein GQ53DRAFT_134630 [Thozetella sp. PMI_491]